MAIEGCSVVAGGGWGLEWNGLAAVVVVVVVAMPRFLAGQAVHPGPHWTSFGNSGSFSSGSQGPAQTRMYLLYSGLWMPQP